MRNGKKEIYLPSGRIIVSKTEDDYYIESTEMRDITLDGKTHCEVRETLDPQIIWKHLVDVKDKWLLTVSTQKGCVHNCKFCDVAPLPFKGNLSQYEIMQQIKMLIKNTPEVANAVEIKKAKLGFARMGEPAHNLTNVLNVMKMLSKKEKTDFNFEFGHINWLPCFNTILPRKTIEGLSGFDVIDKVLDVKENLDEPPFETSFLFYPAIDVYNMIFPIWKNH